VSLALLAAISARIPASVVPRTITTERGAFELPPFARIERALAAGWMPPRDVAAQIASDGRLAMLHRAASASPTPKPTRRAPTTRIAPNLEARLARLERIHHERTGAERATRTPTMATPHERTLSEVEKLMRKATARGLGEPDEDEITLDTPLPTHPTLKQIVEGLRELARKGLTPAKRVLEAFDAAQADEERGHAMNARMGIDRRPRFENIGSSRVFRVLTPEQARKHLARKAVH
jgi:hypothetical protein